jgi:hypothetical protein
MSILTSNHEKTNSEEEGNDGNSKLASNTLKNNQQQTCPTPTPRSILRKHVEKKVSTNTCINVQRTTILINDTDINDERDSDYTGDEDDEEGEESNASLLSIEKEDKNNEQHYRYSARQKQKDKSFPTLSLTSNVNTNTAACTENNQPRNRPTCVTFADDQSTIVRRGSSTPSSGESNIDP